MSAPCPLSSRMAPLVALLDYAGEDTWQCPAADDFRHFVLLAQRRLLDAIESLESSAFGLADEADQMARTAAAAGGRGARRGIQAANDRTTDELTWSHSSPTTRVVCERWPSGPRRSSGGSTNATATDTGGARRRGHAAHRVARAGYHLDAVVQHRARRHVDDRLGCRRTAVVVRSDRERIPLAHREW